MSRSEELEVCRVVNTKLRSGDIISDDELKIAIKHLTSTTEYLKALNDKTLHLFQAKLEDDLRILNGFKDERKKA